MVNAAAFPQCQSDRRTGHSAVKPVPEPSTGRRLVSDIWRKSAQNSGPFWQKRIFLEQTRKAGRLSGQGLGETIGAAMQPGGLTPPVLVKRYAGRRLYRPATSTYLTREDLITMAKSGEPFVAIDADTQKDVTRSYRPIIIEH
jgi:hypothetical protein